MADEPPDPRIRDVVIELLVEDGDGPIKLALLDEGVEFLQGEGRGFSGEHAFQGRPFQIHLRCNLLDQRIDGGAVLKGVAMCVEIFQGHASMAGLCEGEGVVRPILVRLQQAGRCIQLVERPHDHRRLACADLQGGQIVERHSVLGIEAEPFDIFQGRVDQILLA